MSKSEKRRKQRERKRLRRFRQHLGSQVPPSFIDWISDLSTDDQVRELEITAINLARIHSWGFIV